jgi:hypothetical protein
VKPKTPPLSLKKLKDRSVFRMSRLRGARRWLFLPFFVLKSARGHHAELLRREVSQAWLASEAPFWQSLAVRPRRLTDRTTVTRRFRQVELDDHAGIASLAEALLQEARSAERRSTLVFIMRGPLFRLLSKEQQAVLAERSIAYDLPMTGMHGDFHMFNFCKDSKGAFVLLDWEHFDPEGSFVFDYLQFHFIHLHWGARAAWPEFLARFDASELPLRRAAAVFNVDPYVLWVAYVMHQLGVFAERRGGPAALERSERASILRVIEEAVMAVAGPESDVVVRAAV